eukprot:m.225570 g.225570  ORF g.225570 m.225570 type:complete len:460 (+) comp19206_c0_seq13:320-1699(+)
MRSIDILIADCEQLTIEVQKLSRRVELVIVRVARAHSGNGDKNADPKVRDCSFLPAGNVSGTYNARDYLRSLFSEDEIQRMIETCPALLQVRNQYLKARVGQAQYLLTGIQEHSSGCSLSEQQLLRSSFVLQPQYFLLSFPVLFHSEHMVVVDKPFDIQISHGKKQLPRFSDELTVAEALAPRFGDVARCHNLDFATSGCLVMARSRLALRSASDAFNHTIGGIHVAKEYVAVVIGWPEWNTCTVDADIDSHPDSSFKMATAPHVGATDSCVAHAETNSRDEKAADTNFEATGKRQHAQAHTPPNENVVNADVAARWGPSRMPPAPRWVRDGRAGRRRCAVTQARVLRRGLCTLAGPMYRSRVCLVHLLPDTGRRHQLRVHMTSLGHPLLGDVAYAGDISTHRLCLHALAITFTYRGDDGGHSRVLPPSGMRIGSDASHGTPFDAFVSEDTSHHTVATT